MWLSQVALAVERLSVLRWWLIAGEAVAIVAAPRLLDIDLPVWPMLVVLMLQALANGILVGRPARQRALGEHDLFIHLIIDVLALSVLLLLSGGAANPFISLLLPPVAIGALSLSPRRVAMLVGMAILAYSLLNKFYLPLPIQDVERATRLHLAGMWLTFVVSVVLLAWFVVRLTASIRQREAELAAAREQTLRDEQMVALGAFAAGAAHELSTPLSTIAVLAGELGSGVGCKSGTKLDATTRDDIALLQKQVMLCKKIISRLTEQVGTGRLESAAPESADHWLRAIQAHWLEQRPGATCQMVLANHLPAPRIITDPTLEQALLNLLNNAANTGTKIKISATWDASWLTVQVRDEGAGFPETVLAVAGQVPFPSHAGGSGLGLYLANAAITRLGGRLRVFNDKGGVAEVRLPVSPIA